MLLATGKLVLLFFLSSCLASVPSFWQYLDSGGSGFVQQQAFFDFMLMSLGEKLEQKDLNRAWEVFTKYADRDKDGKVSLEDLKLPLTSNDMV